MGWHIDLAPDGQRVTMVFEGDLSDDEGSASAAAFAEALSATDRDVVWDLRAMKGYQSGAREAWQRVLWPLRGRIRSLKIVGAHGVTKVGAMFLAVALGRPWEMTDA